MNNRYAICRFSANLMSKSDLNVDEYEEIEPTLFELLTGFQFQNLFSVHIKPVLERVRFNFI